LKLRDSAADGMLGSGTGELPDGGEGFSRLVGFS